MRKLFVNSILGILQDHAFSGMLEPRGPNIYPLHKLCKCSFAGPVNVILSITVFYCAIELLLP